MMRQWDIDVAAEPTNYTLSRNNRTIHNFNKTTRKFNCQEIIDQLPSYPISDSLVNFCLSIHYIAITICVVGIICNTLFISVLTRPKMRSPINTLMVGLAVSDQIMMLSYGIYILYFRIIYSPLLEKIESSWTTQWIYVTLYHYIYPFSHVAGEWLTLVIAVIRYKSCKAKFPHKEISKKQARRVILLVLLFSCVLCVPSFMYFTVRQSATSCFKTTQTQLVKSLTHYGDFWFWYVFLAYRVIPNVLLVVFTILILWELKKISLNRMVTIGNRSTEDILATKMLVSIVIITIVTELPKMVVPLIYRFKYDTLNNESRDHFVETFEHIIFQHSVRHLVEIFVLLDSCVNFVIYCNMSRMFRDTFVKMFMQKQEANSWFHSVSLATRNRVETDDHLMELHHAVNDCQQSMLNKRHL